MILHKFQKKKEFIVKESLYPTVVLTNVNFVLHAEKQRGLIHILTNYSALALPSLSKLLNISEEKLISVLEKKSFLAEADAKKLAKYFCVFCGS